MGPVVDLGVFLGFGFSVGDGDLENQKKVFSPNIKALGRARAQRV